MAELNDTDYHLLLKYIINSPGVILNHINGTRWLRPNIQLNLLEREGLIRRQKEEDSPGLHYYVTKKGLEKYLSLTYLEDEYIKDSKAVTEITQESIYNLDPDERKDAIERRKQWLIQVRKEDKRIANNARNKLYNFKNRQKVK